MKQRVAVMFLVALTLAACQRSETSSATPLTGGFGAAVVTGDVQMADGGSPEGVEVSVRGTGMSMVLAADGQFAFGGVPESAELGFRRQADGVEASLGITDVSSHLSIQLAKTEARRSSRRRGVGRGTKVSEFEGLVVSATATEVVMFTSKKEEVTIAITPETVIRKGGTLLTAADLLPDTRIHVKAQKVGEAWSAVQIIVQKLPGEDDDDGDDDGDDDDTPAVRKEYEGLVVSTTETQLVLLDSHRNEVTFNVTPQTVIRKGNTPVALADIKAGSRVHVKSSAAADGTLTAVQIIVQKLSGDDDDDDGDDDDTPAVRTEYEGLVVSTTETQLVLRDSHRKEVTFNVTPQTVIRKGNTPVALADIKAGWRVHVKSSAAADGTLTAVRIMVQKNK